MDSSNERGMLSIAGRRIKKHWPFTLIGIGLVFGLLALFATNSWLQWLLLALGTLCMAVSRWLSYMDGAN